MKGPLEGIHINWTVAIAVITSIVYVQGQHSIDVNIHVVLGKTFRYLIPNETLQVGEECFVMTPHDAGFIQLMPSRDNNTLDERIQNFSGPITLDLKNEPRKCGVFVTDINENDFGNWTLKIRRSIGVVTEQFTVRKADPKDLLTEDLVPKERVTINEGQNLHLRFASGFVHNLIECSVNWTNGQEVILEPGVVVGSLEYWGSGLQEDCGVKVTKIGVDDTGTWTLQARNVTGEIVQGEFNVVVIKPTIIVDAKKTIVSGNYESLSLSESNSKYCLWKSPGSEIEKLTAKSCDVKLDSVTKSSEGNWRATFSVPGQLDEIEKSTLVTVKDAETLNATITPSSRIKGGLDLLCRWSTYKYASNTANFCRFVRPDGVAFSLEDGIGNEKYSYFGEGMNFSGNVKDCGITIHSPTTQDEGTWQCVIGDLFNEPKGGFINVPSTRSTKELDLNVKTENISTSEAISVSGGEREVLVESGKDMTFGCTATASLNYCWFKHPNGTVLTPSLGKKITKSSSAAYSGLGLELGDCKITVTEASLQDSGEWTCNMGIQGEADRKVIVNVRVSDGNIVSKISPVEIKFGSSVELGCKTVPEGEALAYCRFVRPDGISFGFTTNEDEVMSRYRYVGAGLEKGACGVAIEPVYAEDFGTWDCHAMLARSSVEGKASIDLINGRVLSGGAVAGIVIGCVIAVVIIGGILFARHQRRRRFSGTELGSLNPPPSL